MSEYRFGVEIEILVAPQEALELCAVQYGYDIILIYCSSSLSLYRDPPGYEPGSRE